MKSRRAVLIAGLGLVFSPGFVLAHHGLDAQFDMKKKVTLVGVITKIDWSNPHVRLFIDVKGANDALTWEVDMGSPNLQMMNGWKIDTYRRGDQVRVIVHPARDGSLVGYGVSVTALQR